MRHLRWHPKPCALGVSGTAKLVADYDDDDKYHKGHMTQLVKELTDLAIVRNYQVTREKLLEMYDNHTKENHDTH